MLLVVERLSHLMSFALIDLWVHVQNRGYRQLPQCVKHFKGPEGASETAITSLSPTLRVMQ